MGVGGDLDDARRRAGLEPLEQQVRQEVVAQVHRRHVVLVAFGTEAILGVGQAGIVDQYM